MNNHFINFLFLIVGILFGIVISIGIKYPFDLKQLDNVKNVCAGQSISKIKIDVTGKIREVQCLNSTIFKLD